MYENLSGKESAMSYITGSSFKRYKEAKSDVSRRYRGIVFSVLAFFTGLAMIAGGVLVDNAANKKDLNGEDTHASASADDIISGEKVYRINNKTGRYEVMFESKVDLKNETGDVKEETTNIDGALEKIDDSRIFSNGNIMEAFGLLVSLSGMVVAWKHIHELSRDKESFETAKDMFYKVLFYDSDFRGFLTRKDLNEQKFYELDSKTMEKLVDEFVRKNMKGKVYMTNAKEKD